jgi:hypothetical protein
MDSIILVAGERARKNHAAILHGISSVGQKPIAQFVGISEATLSRMKDADFERLARILAKAGLKIVPEQMRCYREDVIGALLTLAQNHLDEIKSPDELVWDED